MLGFVSNKEHQQLQEKVRVLTLIVKEAIGEDKYRAIEQQFFALDDNSPVQYAFDKDYAALIPTGDPVAIFDAPEVKKSDVNWPAVAKLPDEVEPSTLPLPPKRPLNALSAPTGFSTGSAPQRIKLIEDNKKSTSQVLGEALVAKAKKRLDSDSKNAKLRREQARKMWREGKSVQQIIKTLKASETSVRRYIKGARRPKALVRK